MTTLETAVLEATPLNSIFILVEWPFPQDLMAYTWFEQEFLLHQAFDEQCYLASAYFVPLQRMAEVQSGDQSNLIQEEG